MGNAGARHARSNQKTIAGDDIHGPWRQFRRTNPGTAHAVPGCHAATPHPVGATLQIELDFLLALARDCHAVAHRRGEPVAPHGVSGRTVKDPMWL
jgi:hypothetical protein